MPAPAVEPEVVHAEALAYLHRASGLGVGPLDLRAGRGEVIGLVGPNGSGKSTLLRLLATDLAPGSGTLLLFGRPAHFPSSALRRRIAFAADEPFHLTPLSGRENLAFFAELRDAGESGRALGGDPLGAFGLLSDADRPVSGYSFGMRRKLLLAEAFASAPELLLLDEPSVGLDPSGLDALERAVRAAAERAGTVLFASNELRRLPHIADRIVFLHEGAVVATGAPDELLARFHGRTRIRITLAGALPDGFADRLREVPGVVGAHANGTWIEVESSAGGAPLPALLGLVLGGGAEVRNVHVREPGLEDVFEELTGIRLPVGEGA